MQQTRLQLDAVSGFGAVAKRKMSYGSLFMGILWKERAAQKEKQERRQNPPGPAEISADREGRMFCFVGAKRELF